MMVHSLRFRLLVVLVLVVVAAVGGIALVGTQVTARTFHRYEDRRALMRDQRLQGLLAQHYAQNEGWSGVQPEVERIWEITGERVVLANEEGQIVADSGGKLVGRSVGQDWGRPAALIVHDGATVGALYADLPGWGVGPPREDFVAPANRALVLVAVVAGLGAVLLILGLSRRILAPVEALTAAARRMEAGDLSQRVEISSLDEIGDLARAFNGMADGLARLEQLRRQLVTDVAHELRTPLSNIRGYLEALRDGVVELDRHTVDSLQEEAMLLSRLVDELQELSLAEAGQLKLSRQPVALAGVVDGVIEASRPRAEGRGLALHVDLPEELPLVDVDPQRVGQVLRNLLDNGLTHTPPGGEITVAAHVSGPWVEVSVRDTGVGIAAADLPYVFERFYRADRSRSRATGGAGLGLAIARQFVELHGGTIKAQSTPGEGSVFTFRLPASPQAGQWPGAKSP